MSDLPKSWSQASVLDLSTMIRGVTYSRGDARERPEEGFVAILRANNITDTGIELSDLVYVPNHLVGDHQYIRCGDVVVATSSGSINVVGKARQANADLHLGFGAFCAVLRPSDETDHSYFGLFLRSDEYRKLVSSLARGVNINNLKRSHFEQITIPLPPLAEQKRIADKLDALLVRVDACRARLARVPGILKRFRQAVLAAAVAGRLTEDWRGENGVDFEWEQVELKDLLVSGPQNGIYKHISAYGSGTRILRIDMFYDGEVRASNDMKRLTLSQREVGEHGLAIGDIVINRVNSPPFVGKSALIRSLPEPCVFESNMMRVRLNTERVLPEYCIRFLNAPLGLARLRQNVKHAVNQSSINQQDVKSVVVDLPSISEQHEIVRRVELLFACADRLAARHAAALAQVEQLTPSLLAKAFRGELVAGEATTGGERGG